jgi:hypothetical protein
VAPWSRSERGHAARRGGVALPGSRRSWRPLVALTKRRRKETISEINFSLFIVAWSMTQETITIAGPQGERAGSATPTPVPQNIAAAEALIVTESSRLCAAAVRHKARAIVLTGSMSRGEATLKREGASWRVLGDATFLVVFDGSVPLRVAELERDIDGTLRAQGVRCKVVVVTATAANLRNMRPHIYAYELRERGVVVWGDQEALHLIPRFAASQIPEEDGWWLLCNRMIEQLQSAAEADSFDDDCTAVRYRIAKLYLAMAACYLLAIGQYAPSYRDRAARLQKLAASKDAPPAPIPLQRFSTFVSQCTELKLQGETVDGPNQFPQWRDAVSDAEVLWRWALGRMLGLDPHLSRTDLLAAVAARQPILARAKGWVRAAYVRPSAFCRHGLRWARLAYSMSPRYLVYDVASELFFNTPRPAITPSKLAAMASRLPLPPAEADQQLSWRAVARLVAHNFHVLVSSSRS